MGFKYDATGVEVKEFTGFDPMPENYYDLEVINVEERLTRNGDQMVNVTCEVVDSLQFDGRKLWHNVTFLPPTSKAAGIALHFIKTIGQPFSGPLDIDPTNWIGKRFRAKVIVEKYTNKDGHEKQKNSIVVVEPYQGTQPKAPAIPNDQDVPF